MILIFRVIVLSALMLFTQKALNAQADSLVISSKYAVPDGMGNLFVITENNTLLKVDSNLKILISQSLIRYGIASSMECNGATEIAVYCYNTGRLTVFDDFLKEKNQYDLSQLIKPKPTLICLSKTGWWGYDESTGLISNYRTNFQKVWSLPKLPGMGKEIIRMAEIEYSLPNILFADTTFIIPKVELLSSNTGTMDEYKFQSIPILNYNTSELFGYFNDTLKRLSLHRELPITFFISKTCLNLKNVMMVTRSFNTYFFILPKSIIALRHLVE